MGWKLVLCGSRQDTYRDFRNAWERAQPGDSVLLLVDSEGPVTLQPPAHLRDPAHDGWSLGFAPAEAIHLMVQVMETWIVADPEPVADYYGPGFLRSRLPRRPDLEEEPKARVTSALEEATRGSAKGAYHKVRHASDLLKRLDPAHVQARCRHCRRLFDALDRIIGAS